MDTPILTGYQIYHNYFREHEGLNGITPAEASGIKIEGKNKWIIVIQNAKLVSYYVTAVMHQHAWKKNNNRYLSYFLENLSNRKHGIYSLRIKDSRARDR